MMIFLRNRPSKSIILIIIPLVLSAFIHLWNPKGFPPLYFDEGIYMRRAMNLLETHSPQEDPYFYDHPYFGQIFLAGIFWMTGYPSSLHPSVSIKSIETLYSFPRILMGVLAIIDTLLVYKISERRYSRNVAFIASTLFAVMPITSLLMRVLLDGIQLPFFLSSIFFADRVNIKDLKNGKRRFVTTLFSGILLGLAVFTKIPVFTMIPLVGFLVFTNNKNSFKLLGVWLIPIILIPTIWPVYAISSGHFNDWLKGVYYQTHREAQTFFASLAAFFKADPVLFVIGTAGLIFAAVRRDYFLLLWAIPYLIALYFVGWVLIYHFILLLPVFCIAGARLLLEILNRIRSKRIAKISLFATVAGILIFGITTTFLLITSNVNSVNFEGALFLTQYLNNNNFSFKNNNLTVISDASYLWISQHVFHLPAIYKTFFDSTLSRTHHSLLIVDPGFIQVMQEHNKQGNLLHTIYDTNNTKKLTMFGESQYNQNISIYLYEPKASNSH
jgi:4-amino-4-deoxy-L-arabinose transferase-like glycosyltransferase